MKHLILVARDFIIQQNLLLINKYRIFVSIYNNKVENSTKIIYGTLKKLKLDQMTLVTFTNIIT